MLLLAILDFFCNEMVTFDFLESVPLGDGPAWCGEHVRPVAQLRPFCHAPQLHLSCMTRASIVRHGDWRGLLHIIYGISLSKGDGRLSREMGG